VVVGGAFGKIVTSLVNDIIMPPVGLVIAASISPICSLIGRAAFGPRWPTRRRTGATDQHRDVPERHAGFL